jgi:hypothetical protein
MAAYENFEIFGGEFGADLTVGFLVSSFVESGV